MVNMITKPAQPTHEAISGLGDVSKISNSIDPLIPKVNIVPTVPNIDNARLRSREAGVNYFKRRVLVIGAAILTLGGTVAGIFAAKSEGTQKPIEPVKTTLAIPDEPGEGVQSLVEEEAAQSGVVIDWETTQKLVEQARELNPGEPRFEEPYAVVDLPDAPEVSVAPATAP